MSAGQRLGEGNRACARRGRTGPELVVRRQDVQQTQHVQRLQQRRAVTHHQQLHHQAPINQRGRLGGRAAGGREHGAAARPLARSHPAGAVRGPAQHDGRLEHPADHRRVGAVGQPQHLRRLRLHAAVLPLLQPAGGRVAAHARLGRLARQARQLLGVLEVQCQTARCRGQVG